MVIERWELAPSSRPDRYLLKVRGDRADVDRVVALYPRVCQEPREMGDPVYQWAVYVVDATLNERLAIQDHLRSQVARPPESSAPARPSVDLSGVLAELSLVLEGLTDLTEEEQAHVAKKMQAIQEKAAAPAVPAEPAPAPAAGAPPATDPSLDILKGVFSATLPPTAPPPAAPPPSPPAAVPPSRPVEPPPVRPAVPAVPPPPPRPAEPPSTPVRPAPGESRPPEPAKPAPPPSVPAAPPPPPAPTPPPPKPAVAPAPAPVAAEPPPKPAAPRPAVPAAPPPSPVSVAPPPPPPADVPPEQLLRTGWVFPPEAAAAKEECLKKLTEVARTKAKKPLVVFPVFSLESAVSDAAADSWIRAARDTAADVTFVILPPEVLSDYLEQASARAKQAGTAFILVPQAEVASRLLYVDLMVELMLVKRRK
jgi:hypothetical protein